MYNRVSPMCPSTLLFWLKWKRRSATLRFGNKSFCKRGKIREKIASFLMARICSYNRHFAEYAGYWSSTNFLKEASREARCSMSACFRVRD